MSFWEKIKEKAGELANEAKKFQNENMMQAVAAGVAMIARADGNVSSGEKMTLINFIENFDALKVFKTIDVIKAFNSYLEYFDIDEGVGETKALTAIGKLKGKEQDSRFMIRVCVRVASSDGNFDDKEREVAKRICRELGLNPKEFEIE